VWRWNLQPLDAPPSIRHYSGPPGPRCRIHTRHSQYSSDCSPSPAHIDLLLTKWMTDVEVSIALLTKIVNSYSICLESTAGVTFKRLHASQIPTVGWIRREASFRHRHPGLLPCGRNQDPESLVGCSDSDHQRRPAPVVPFEYFRLCEGEGGGDR